jgi:MarR family transcriptional regulator, organic hydroperoxide resistance regulator
MDTPSFSADAISLLIVQVCKAHRAAAQTNLAHIGLHPGQEMFLMQLWQQDGLTQSQLAEGLCVQPPTVHKMLSRMEASGLVRRETDAEDNRVSRVYLTAEGKALRQSVEQSWTAMETQTLRKLTTEERVLLRRLLLQVLTNLTDE